MGWSAGGRGTGDPPGPDSGPPRHGAHHHHVPGGGTRPGTGGTPRDERLAGFAAGGEWDTRAPSAALAGVLEALSGRDWHCPGATDDEIVGIVRHWAEIESWAAAGKLGAIRELIRREERPWRPTDQHADLPGPWSESLTHELALALASSAGSADRTVWLAWELERRLPGTGALLADGSLTYAKAKAVAEAFRHLSDTDAAHAEALILGRLAGKTHLQVMRLAAAAAATVDPEGEERRRKDAEAHAARVRLWREQSGAAALAGFDLPPDEALAAHANVSARAEHYRASGAFPGARMDQLRAMGYLDLLNCVSAETRIAEARARSAAAHTGSPAPTTGSGVTPEEDAGAGRRPDGDEDRDADTDDGPSRGGTPDGRPAHDGPAHDGPAHGSTTDDGPAHDGPAHGSPTDDGPADDGPAGGAGPGGKGPPGGGPRHDQPPGRGPVAARQPRTDLVIPLVTLLGTGNRPGESPQFGALDPALCRDLAAAAAAGGAGSRFCITVTDQDGIAIGHGCARAQKRPSRGAGPSAPQPPPALPVLPARVNITIALTDLRNLARSSRAGPAGHGGPWGLFLHSDDPGAPGGYGTWTLTIPDGRELTVRFEPVPTFACDHSRESHAYQPNDTLRHLIQVRDGECTFPSCTRQARESDFEHAVPYHKGGRTCGCNSGARSRRCHRVKQSRGWSVTQPQPGFHRWTTPTGRVYTQEPRRYPA